LGVIRGSDLDGRFSFMRVRPDPKAGVPDFNVTGDPYPWMMEGELVYSAAREATNNKAVPLNQIARMPFTGYDPEGFPAFTFVY
jgi:hypothetical protein